MTEPTLLDIYLARPRVYRHMRPSPLLRHPLLQEALGCDVWVKHENHNPTGAFKIRGGFNLIGSLSPDERRRGVISASTGNHGQSMALACRVEGVPCTIVTPVGNNPEKNAAMRAFGADVIEHGRDFDEARELVERLQAERGLRYVHSGDEPLLLAGVGTYALEIFEELPDVEAIFVPIGGGSGACGCVMARTGLGSAATVIGVQAERADAFARSWRGPSRVVGERADTFAEGMATRVTFDLPFGMLKRELNDIVTLSEREIADGIRLAWRTTHNLAEGAGAASIAALLRQREAWRGRKVACIMSGGNLDTATLARIMKE